MGWRGWIVFAVVQLVGVVLICPLAPRTGSYDTEIS